MTSMTSPWAHPFSFGHGRRRSHPPFGHHTAAMSTPPADDPTDHEHHHEHHGPGRRDRRHGHSPFGQGFGPGFPPPRRGFGRRHGSRTSRGDVRAAVLALVAERPRHGYEIIQEIADRSGGTWRPSPGSIYPTVAQLEDEGLVRTEKIDGRRMVQLTDAGTQYIEEHRAELDAVWESVGRRRDDMDDGAVDLWEQLGQLHAAAQQVMSAGTPEQITTATTALTEARKTIYRLLAE